MGMFDWIKHTEPCPVCGKTMRFQSKDGPCQLNTIAIDEVDEFYGDCSEPKGTNEERRAHPCFKVWVRYVREGSDMSECLMAEEERHEALTESSVPGFLRLKWPIESES